MINFASLIIGIIAYSIVWYISSSIQSIECNSKVISYCINILFTISTVFLLLPFVFENSFTYNIINFIMLLSYLITISVLFFNISNTKCLPNFWFNVVPTILFMLLILIYAQFNITKSVGITAILFGLYFAIFNLVYYFTKSDSRFYHAFVTLCGIILVIFGTVTIQNSYNYQYVKLKTI